MALSIAARSPRWRASASFIPIAWWSKYGFAGRVLTWTRKGRRGPYSGREYPRRRPSQQNTLATDIDERHRPHHRLPIRPAISPSGARDRLSHHHWHEPDYKVFVAFGAQCRRRRVKNRRGCPAVFMLMPNIEPAWCYGHDSLLRGGLRGTGDKSVIDLYRVLGVERRAPRDEIHPAYRRKAKISHPDSGGSVEAFGEVATAYTVLSDTKRRERYDTTGEIEFPRRHSRCQRHRNHRPEARAGNSCRAGRDRAGYRGADRGAIREDIAQRRSNI